MAAPAMLARTLPTLPRGAMDKLNSTGRSGGRLTASARAPEPDLASLVSGESTFVTRPTDISYEKVRSRGGVAS